MDNEFIPICGCLQYPHVDLELRHNPEMDVSQIIAYHLTALMASYPERETLAKVAKAAKVGFGTVQRARNGDGNLTVQNLALIAAAFHRRPEDLLVEPIDKYPADVPIQAALVSEPPKDESDLLQGYRDASEEVREILLALATSPENGKSTNIPPATWAPPDFQKPVPPSPASHQPDHAPDQKVIQVVVSDIHMSFRSMVVFLVKAAFAAIPAIIIIAMIWVFIFSFLSGFIRYRG